MIVALETLVKTCCVWNEQQKTQVLAWLECAKDFGDNRDRCSEKLEEAKEIISEYINILKGDTKNWKKTQEKAEQFISEVEK